MQGLLTIDWAKRPCLTFAELLCKYTYLSCFSTYIFPEPRVEFLHWLIFLYPAWNLRLYSVMSSLSWYDNSLLKSWSVNENWESTMNSPNFHLGNLPKVSVVLAQRTHQCRFNSCWASQCPAFSNFPLFSYFCLDKFLYFHPLSEPILKLPLDSIWWVSCTPTWWPKLIFTPVKMNNGMITKWKSQFFLSLSL